MPIMCAWGRSVGLEDDNQPCARPVTHCVHLHSGPGEFAVNVCELHYVKLLRLTDPHDA